MPLSDLTVVVLKDILRKMELSTKGTKTELMNRLRLNDAEENWRLMVDDDGNFVGEVSETTVQNDTNGGSESSSHQGKSTEELTGLELEKKRRELVEYELELARREIELLRLQNTARIRPQDEEPRAPRINIKVIAELLEYFDGNSDLFEIWEREVRMIRATYSLDDAMSKMLIGLRLKGKAATWLHSRPEYLQETADSLLRNLKEMYSYPRTRRELRRKCEEREWRKDEPFSEYVHEKMVLANRIPLDDNDEVLDCVIDGIPDVSIRDHARMSQFESVNKLAMAKMGRRGTGNRETERGAKRGASQRYSFTVGRVIETKGHEVLQMRRNWSQKV